MSKSIWLLIGAALGATATYPYLDGSFDALATSDVDAAGNRIGGWGMKQRITGTGGSVLGKIKQNVGEALGDEQTANSGVFDQAKGAVKDAAGQAANTVSEAVHEINRP